jgi:hypothetical protein
MANTFRNKYILGTREAKKNRRVVEYYIMKNFKAYVLYITLKADPVNGMKCIAYLALKEQMKDAYRSSTRNHENKKEPTWETLEQMGSKY